MTTAHFARLVGPSAQALANVKRLHCTPPTYAPPVAVDGVMACPACQSRLTFTVDTAGRTSGRCVAANCIRWNNQ